MRHVTDPSDDLLQEERDDPEAFDAEIVPPGALAVIERQQIDVQIATAKKFPRRGIKELKQKMISYATLDEETAAQCFYTLPRAGKRDIKGPSVRLAEIAVSCYGNIVVGARIVDNDGKMITAQGICWDLENNVRISIENKRRITDKKGNTFNDDMQVVTGNAAAAIAFRNAVFKVIPSVLFRAAYDEARAVAIGDVSTLSVKRTKIVDRLLKMGVTQEAVLAKLERVAVDDIDLSDLEKLIGLGTALKEGDTTIEEAFPEMLDLQRQKDDLTRKANEERIKKAQQANAQAKSQSAPVGAGSDAGDNPTHPVQANGEQQGSNTEDNHPSRHVDTHPDNEKRDTGAPANKIADSPHYAKILEYRKKLGDAAVTAVFKMFGFDNEEQLRTIEDLKGNDLLHELAMVAKKKNKLDLG